MGLRQRSTLNAWPMAARGHCNNKIQHLCRCPRLNNAKDQLNLCRDERVSHWLHDHVTCYIVIYSVIMRPPMDVSSVTPLCYQRFWFVKRTKHERSHIWRYDHVILPKELLQPRSRHCIAEISACEFREYLCRRRWNVRRASVAPTLAIYWVWSLCVVSSRLISLQ